MALLSGSTNVRTSQYTADLFNGNGVTTVFTLSKPAATASAVLVTINGVKQQVNAYSASGRTLTFSEAPASGDTIEVLHLGTQGVTMVLDDESVTSAKLVNGSVVPAKTDIGSLTGTGAALLPAGTTAQRPLTPAAGWERFNTTLSCKEVWDGVNWINMYDGMISQWAYGTGGAITTSGSWRIHTFTTTDNLVLTQPGRVQLLIVAGGGGGGADVPGGGGAGGIVYSEKYPIMAAGTYTCTVGGGGSASTQPARNGIGGNSSITGPSGFSLVAFGGGAGGGWAYVNPSEGGSGGGADGQDTYRTRSGARALQQRDLYKYTIGYGNRGGNGGGSVDGYSTGGGGGGAGMPGGNGDSCTTSSLSTSWQGRTWEAAGGDGLPFDISGTTQWYGGGGGGSSNNATSASYGGRGGGGNADAISGSYNSGNINGIANTGGGGGGRGNGTLGGNGGSGIVIVRYMV